jgi:hypothetical protein
MRRRAGDGEDGGAVPTAAPHLLSSDGDRGQQLQVQVPQGVGPGIQFQVQLPAAAAPKSAPRGRETDVADSVYMANPLNGDGGDPPAPELITENPARAEHTEYDEGDAESPSAPAASMPEMARGSIVKHKGRVGVVSRVRGPLSTPLSVDVVSSLSCFGSGASAHCCR